MTKTIAREALELAKQIVAAQEDVVAAQERVRSLEERFALLFANGTSNGAAVQEDKADIPEETVSAASRILAAFKRQGGKKVPVQAVVNELSDLDPMLVRSNAARFARQGKLKHVTRGVYKYVLPVDTKAEE